MTVAVPMVSLHRCCDLIKGTEPGRKNYKSSGMIRFLRVQDITGTRESGVFLTFSDGLTRVVSKDILFALDGSPGVVSRGYEGAISSGIRLVKSKHPDKLLDDYLYYALQSKVVQNVVKRYSTGITIKHASKCVKHLSIPRPTLKKQQVIAETLAALEYPKKDFSALKKELTTFYQGTLNTILNPVRIERLGWGVSPLKRVCKEIYRYPTFYGFRFIKEGVPVLKISNFLENDQFDPVMANYDYIPQTISLRFPKTIVQRGDLVMGVRGTYVGRTVPVPSYLEGANCSPNLIRISPDPELIRPRFLWHFTCSEWWAQQINRLVHNWKQKFGTIRADRLKKVTIPCPSLDAQDNVIDYLDRCISLIRQTDAVLLESKDLYEFAVNHLFENLSKESPTGGNY